MLRLWVRVQALIRLARYNLGPRLAHPTQAPRHTTLNPQKGSNPRIYQSSVADSASAPTGSPWREHFIEEPGTPLHYSKPRLNLKQNEIRPTHASLVPLTHSYNIEIWNSSHQTALRDFARSLKFCRLVS